jgi:hypothetical protein
MSVDPLQERLDYYGLAEVRQATLAGIGRALKRRLDGALDGFYKVIASRRELSAYFDSPQQMSRAKGMQAEHWQAVFRDGVDRRFYDRATRIGNVHARIGLEHKWYVGAYGLVLDELVTAIIAPGWQAWLPWKRAQARQVAIFWSRSRCSTSTLRFRAISTIPKSACAHWSATSSAPRSSRSLRAISPRASTDFRKNMPRSSTTSTPRSARLPKRSAMS